jgi:hypothetical protein
VPDPAPAFRRLPRCRYGVYDPGRPEDGYESDCGEPAAWEVIYPGAVPFPLCDRHARELEETHDA